MTEQEQKIKEKLLMDLIAHMDDSIGEKMRPKKAISIEVSSPESKAKELVASKDDLMEEASESPSEESDEDRMKALIGESDEGEEDETPSKPTSFKNAFRRK